MLETATQSKYSSLNKKECKEKIMQLDAQCDLLEGFIFNSTCENQRRGYIDQFLNLKEERRLVNIQKSFVEDPYNHIRPKH